MNQQIEKRLEQLTERHQEVTELMSQPEVVSNNDEFRKLSREYAQLEPVVSTWAEFHSTRDDLREAREMLAEPDADIQAMANDEIARCEQQMTELEAALKILLLPRDSRDDANIFLEIRAGTGGDEAAIFAGDLFRMYSKYAESQRWQIETISASHGEHGGFKEIIARVEGEGAYSRLKFESGAHRVQRVPETESQGRIHTSACTVAVLAEREQVDDVDVDTGDLRIDTFRSSGAGGQHVNTTDSAIRITHLPTGLVVECQDERSQHKNKARALSLLKARLLDQERSALAQEQSAERKSLVGSGDRSERIRTYNFPQGRVTDHRINVTLYKLGDIVDGNLGELIDPLTQRHQADLLSELGG